MMRSYAVMSSNGETEWTRRDPHPMIGEKWQRSDRDYEVAVYQDVPIPVDDGSEIIGNVVRPMAENPVPV